MNGISVLRSLFLILALTLLSGCSSSSNSITPLSVDNLNLVFVVNPDLTYNAPGDINPDTANLTSQGLQRSLLMATYLKTQVMGTNNVTGIYTLTPMIHLQTANNYPDSGQRDLRRYRFCSSGGHGPTVLKINKGEGAWLKKI